MAEGRKWFRKIFFELDAPSAKRVGNQMEDALAQAGEKGGREFIRAMRAAYDQRIAKLREELADGTIDVREFRRRADEAGKAFNEGMLRQIRKAREEGNLTDREYVRLTRTFKRVGDEGTNAFRRVRNSISDLWRSGIGQLIGVGGITMALRRSFDAANELDVATATLAATANIGGYDIEFLNTVVEESRRKFSLSAEAAAKFTTELAWLTDKAGDIRQTASALEAVLDIGAARGLTATETLQRLQQVLMGSVDGYKALFDTTQKELLDRYAASLGTTAGRLTEVQKAQAVLNEAMTDGGKVRGEYHRWLQTAAGQQHLLSQSIDETYQALGKSLQPTLVAILPVFTMLTRVATGLIEVLQDLGRYLTSGLLWAMSALAEANAAAARGYAAVLTAAASVADFFGADGAADKWQRRADAINAEADALRNWASAAREVARETNAEAGGAFGGRARLPGSSLPPASTTTTRTDSGGSAGSPQGFGRIDAGGVQTSIPLPATIPAPVVDKIANERNAEEFVDPWQLAMLRITDEIELVTGAAAGLGTALAEGGLAGMARYAGMKAKEALANMISHTAKAIGALANPMGAALKGESAPMHFKAAAQFGVEAAAWKALSGGGGGSARAIAAGGSARAIAAGGGVGMVASTSGASAQQADPREGELHVYIDPLSPDDPVFVRTVHAAGQRGDRYFGESRVHVHRTNQRRF